MATGFPFVKWTDEDHARFLAMLKSGEPPETVAAALGRTVGAIESRRRKVFVSEVESGVPATSVAASFHVDVSDVQSAVSKAARSAKAQQTVDAVAAAIDRTEDRAYLEDIVRRAQSRLADLSRAPVKTPTKCLFGRNSMC